jgi:dipeptidyl aminopeptidase/acylaminoacyl peptidase
MSPDARRGGKRLLALLLVLPALGCGKGDPEGKGPAPAAALPPATPGLELPEEDYARARAGFRTRLVRKGPAPQRWVREQPPRGVVEVEYRSAGLPLRAWVNRPPGGKDGKHPAVLYLHGGWAFAREDWDQAQPFRDAGFVVMTPILRGENGLPGHFTMFHDEVDDVLAAADHLARVPGVDGKRLYVAGHSAGGTLAMLAAMASDRFRAAVSLSGSPDRVEFLRGGFEKEAPFDPADLRELRIRSPVAYATSFKCPARLYVGTEEVGYHASTRRTALLAKGRGLDVEAVLVPGDHFSSVPEALRQAIAFFNRP